MRQGDYDMNDLEACFKKFWNDVDVYGLPTTLEGCFFDGTVGYLTLYLYGVWVTLRHIMPKTANTAWDLVEAYIPYLPVDFVSQLENKKEN